MASNGLRPVPLIVKVSNCDTNRLRKCYIPGQPPRPPEARPGLASGGTMLTVSAFPTRPYPAASAFRRGFAWRSGRRAAAENGGLRRENGGDAAGRHRVAPRRGRRLGQDRAPLIWIYSLVVPDEERNRRRAREPNRLSVSTPPARDRPGRRRRPGGIDDRLQEPSSLMSRMRLSSIRPA